MNVLAYFVYGGGIGAVVDLLVLVLVIVVIVWLIRRFMGGM